MMMPRAACAAATVTVAALLLATIRLPTVAVWGPLARYPVEKPRRPHALAFGTATSIHWQWVWAVNWNPGAHPDEGAPAGDGMTTIGEVRLHWPVLLTELTLIVLVGGGGTTWLTRRPRRRAGLRGPCRYGPA